MTERRIGVIGAGTVGRWHMHSYQQAGATIVALAEPDEESGRRSAAEYGAHHYTDYREMLATEQLDAVSVCTPPYLHREHAMAVLERGLHVLCEKPFTSTMDDARVLVDAAERSDRVFLMGFVHRFYEPAQRVRQYTRAGDLGTLISFRNRFAVRNRLVRPWVADPERAGGGAFMDTAMHAVDLFRFIVGEIVAISAQQRTVTGGLHVEDTGVLVVRSADGVLGVIEADWMTPVVEYTFSVYGTDGAAHVGYDPAELRTWTRARPSWTNEPLQSLQAMTRFDREIEHFLACIDGRDQPAVTAYDGLRALQIIRAGYRSTTTRAEENCAPE
jgi:UDP-N-acetylglucosamine 3-dehydrogenase